jgi:hypothetical protein
VARLDASTQLAIAWQQIGTPTSKLPPSPVSPVSPGAKGGQQLPETPGTPGTRGAAV